MYLFLVQTCARQVRVTHTHRAQLACGPECGWSAYTCHGGHVEALGAHSAIWVFPVRAPRREAPHPHFTFGSFTFFLSPIIQRWGKQQGKDSPDTERPQPRGM